MPITAYSGPLISYGVTGVSTNGLTQSVPPDSYNDQRAPSIFDLGTGLTDPRAFYDYQIGSGVSTPVYGFYRERGYVDYVPATANASAFVVNTVVSTGVTTYTLTAASSSGGTYSTTITAPESGATTGTLIAIDSTAASLAFGQAGTVTMWNPGGGTGRNISIITSSYLDGGTFSVAGRDMYGYKMTETIAVSSNGSATSSYGGVGKKAFKYISSITNTTTPTSTGVSIGFGDTFGMPLYVPYCGADLSVRLLASAYSSAVAVALSSANFVLGSTMATATSTSPDARGTYASTTATNGTLRVQISVVPSASAVYSITSSNVQPLFGYAQYSSV